MKRFQIITILLFVVCLLSAQEKPHLQVYLWDVTQSMKGYQDKTPDIYDDVVDYIEQDINLQKDENKTIVVCPFQERILEKWEGKATNAGKSDLITQIRHFQNDDITYTNIANPLNQIEKEYINNPKYGRVTIILLTDGKQNTNGGNSSLLEFISKFKQHNGFAYMRYVALTAESVDDDVKGLLQKVPNAEFTDKWGRDLYISVPSKVQYNIKDDHKVEIPVECDKNEKLPAQIRVRLSQLINDSILQIDKTIEIMDNKITFELDYDYNVLKTQISDVYEMPLYLQLLDGEFEDAKTNVKTNITLVTPQTKLQLINKPEKTLKIRVKKVIK